MTVQIGQLAELETGGNSVARLYLGDRRARYTQVPGDVLLFHGASFADRLMIFTFLFTFRKMSRIVGSVYRALPSLMQVVPVSRKEVI